MRKTKKRKRRYMSIAFTPEFLGLFLTKGKIEIVKTPLPDDAEYVTTHYDSWRDVFVLLFYHPSFKIVKDGVIPPRIEPNSIEYKRL